MGVAVGVNTVTAVAMDGTGEGVSVVIKTIGTVAGAVGVGSVVVEKPQPVNRKSPTNRIDISL
jgi:hypothetical protein